MNKQMTRHFMYDESGLNDADTMAERYCVRCIHQPIEIDAKGNEYATDCDKDCCLANPKFFEEVEE